MPLPVLVVAAAVRIGAAAATREGSVIATSKPLDRIARRLNDELVAGRGCPHPTTMRQAVGEERIARGAGACEGDRRAGILAAQRVASCRCARQHVVAAGERADVGARRASTTRGAGVRGDVADAHAADIEEIAAERAVRSMPSRCCALTWLGDGEADAAELVARRIEHFAAEIEQAAERAAARRCARCRRVPADVLSANCVRSGS